MSEEQKKNYSDTVDGPPPVTSVIHLYRLHLSHGRIQKVYSDGVCVYSTSKGSAPLEKEKILKHQKRLW